MKVELWQSYIILNNSVMKNMANKCFNCLQMHLMLCHLHVSLMKNIFLWSDMVWSNSISIRKTKRKDYIQWWQIVLNIFRCWIGRIIFEIEQTSNNCTRALSIPIRIQKLQLVKYSISSDIDNIFCSKLLQHLWKQRCCNANISKNIDNKPYRTIR